MALEICILISIKKTLHNVSRALFLSMSMLSVALKTDLVVSCCEVLNLKLNFCITEGDIFL